MADKKPVSPAALGVQKNLIYSKGTDAAIKFAESQPEGAQWSTHDLVRAVIDATWDDIRKAG